VNCLQENLEIRTVLYLLDKKGKDKLVAVNHNESVEHAIRLMLKENYSQLPVMKGDKAVGVISYESLAKTVFNFTESKSKPPTKFRAKSFMERISKIFSVEDDVMDLMSVLAEKSYVLICKRSKVTDIITCYDALWFLRTYGESFLNGEFKKMEF
jgi:predicted transcriptional regulator